MLSDTVTRPAGRPVVRPAVPGDLPALRAFTDRCSFDTLYRRFHGATGTPLRRELERAATTGEGRRSWVAVAGGHVRGVATLAVGRSGEAEVAFLVEDAWQRRGLGRALARRLASEARRAGHDGLVALVQGDNDRAVRFARSIAPGTSIVFDGAAEYRLTIPVDPSPVRLAAGGPGPVPAPRRPSRPAPVPAGRPAA